MISKKIKVLIVDDTALYRQLLSKGLSKDRDIEVVGTASDPYIARDKIIEFRPDVMVLDVEMPRMNGIEFLRRLIPKYPMPVIVVSGVSNGVFDALQAGAIDFIQKPSIQDGNGLDLFIKELISKVKISISAKIKVNRNELYVKTKKEITKKNKRIDIIAIGASTGGTEAIFKLIKSLPNNIPATLIVQHMPKDFTKMYAERLNRLCSLEVKEAEDGEQIELGNVYIAPGDYHMKVKKIENKYIIKCIKCEKINGHRPSVDVLFESVANEVGNNSIGIILTGMGKDGANGLLQMRNNGAFTIGQDENTSIVYGMPKAAYDIGAIDKQMPLDHIPNILIQNI